MEKKIRDLLEKDFPNNLIKQRRGRTGGNLSYIPSPAFIQRLNDGFDGEWSFEIIEYKEISGEAVVLGQLTGGGLIKQQFGNSTISVYSETHARAGEVISMGDDFKAAASDALKKCATMFGVGLSVYGGKKEGVQKEEYADPEEVYGHVLASAQKGEELLAPLLDATISEHREGVLKHKELTDGSLPELEAYVISLRNVYKGLKAEAKMPPGRSKSGTQSDQKAKGGKKPTTEPPSQDVIALKQQAAMLQNAVLRDNLMPKVDLDALKMKLFDGSRNLPDDAGLLAQYIEALGKMKGE